MVWNTQHIPCENGLFYCRTAGNGTPLLLIHGAACDSDFFGEIGAFFAKRYRVILYDRRGYGRTTVPPLQTESCERFFSCQASDAATILSQLCPNEKALVLGCSYGALIAGFTMALYSEKVRHAFLHEPPLYDLLADQTQSLALIENVFTALAKEQYTRALNRFLLFMGESSDVSQRPLTPSEEESFQRNGDTFIRYEFAQAFDKCFHLPTAIDAKRITLLVGDAGAGKPLALCADRYSQKTGCPICIVPGGHNGARDMPASFTEALFPLLNERCELS